jgi:hypothetical protein
VTRSALARHPLAIAGAVIVTVSAVVFLALVIGVLLGLFRQNPYAGLVIFVAIPALFILGLLLIPLGMWLQQRKERRDPSAVTDWPIFDFRRADVRRRALFFVGLTAVNVVVLLLAGYGSLHWMESPTFCGQVCHAPMQPQFTSWQGAPHGRIACVNCHIAEGAAGFLQAKLAGTRQLAQVSTGSYPRPIPPGAHMPAGAQAATCRDCHIPLRRNVDQIRVIREYADDEKNTETMTVLQMHVGGVSSSGRAIHWHANPANRVEYVATDATRETIPYVKVTDAKGQVKEFRAADTTDQMIRDGQRRTMDCTDCHNTVGHPISPTPEKALDQAIAAGRVSRDLPFAKREGVRVVKASYPSQEEGLRAIVQELRGFYQSQASIDQQKLAQTIAGVQDVYRRNVFPTMKVTFGAYPTNRGHMTSTGCFRCHDSSHTAADGSTISGDCEYCHKQIEKP